MLFSAIQDAFIEKSSLQSKNNVVLLPYSTNIDHNEYHYLPLIDDENGNQEEEVEMDIIKKESNITKLYFAGISLLGIYLLHKMLKKTKI
jgi:hypothetical protein